MAPLLSRSRRFKRFGEGPGDGMQEDREALRVESRQLQEEPVARRRLHGLEAFEEASFAMLQKMLQLGANRMLVETHQGIDGPIIPTGRIDGQ
jgi:hypothetical protein